MLGDAELREQMLRAAMAELNSIRRRYAQLEELAGLFKAIDKVKLPKARRRTAGQVSARQNAAGTAT